MGRRSPDERFRALIVFRDVLSDGRDELWDASEGATAEALVGQFAEPSLHQIEPRGAGGREMEMKSRVFFQPASDARVLVGSVIVHD